MTIVRVCVFRETFGTLVACQGADLELRDMRPPSGWLRKWVPMTASLNTTGEAFEREQTADFRLSARQRDMLRTLNTLFEEVSPARIEATEEPEFVVIPEPLFDVRNVSRVVRD